MNRADLEQVFAMAEKRDVAHYAWLRHLHLLAAGALTVLVSLQGGVDSTGAARTALNVAWLLLAAGILLGGVALYGAEWKERALLQALTEEHRKVLRRKQAGETDAVAGPVSIAGKPWWIQWSEAGFLMSLAVATICLALFAILRT